MAQEKGRTGNPNGRPKGVPNKTTTTVRNWIVELINENRDLIREDFKALEPKDRLDVLQKLLPFIMPKIVKEEEVKGACYDEEDVIVESKLDWGSLEQSRVKKWSE